MTYTENELVEQPAINLFSQLDWDTNELKASHKNRYWVTTIHAYYIGGIFGRISIKTTTHSVYE